MKIRAKHIVEIPGAELLKMIRESIQIPDSADVTISIPSDSPGSFRTSEIKVSTLTVTWEDPLSESFYGR